MKNRTLPAAIVRPRIAASGCGEAWSKGRDIQRAKVGCA